MKAEPFVRVIVVKQIGSPIRRDAKQRRTLIGLGLNKMHRMRELEDTPPIRGMVDKIPHLVEVVETMTVPVSERRFGTVRNVKPPRKPVRRGDGFDDLPTDED